METTENPQVAVPSTGLTDLPPVTRGFEAMNLDPSVKQALDDMGYAQPMPVQTAVYDLVVNGIDVMVQSRTGSGKTAAFGIPIAQKLQAGAKGVQALVLAPTRELALQVAQEVGRISAYKNLAVVPIYGGAPMGRQVDALKAGAQIIAGTPGRVLDHIRRGTLDLSQVKMFVLDECDEMLSMGFLEDIEKIIAELPSKENRQTLLFSATMPEDIERIAKRHMRTYEKIALSDGNVSVSDISHNYYLVSGLGRTRDLLRVIEFEQPDSAIVFCNTRDDTSMVAQFLQRSGYDAEAISSDLGQSDRERVMGRMRDKNLRFLVATDIAARGIDISDLTHVINYTFPESPEVYVHRTGRTGRAGKSGTAISLIGPREIGAFYYLKLIYKIRPEEREFPSEREIRTRREAERFARIGEEVPEEPGDEWRSLARRLVQSSDGERVVAAVLKRLVDGAPTITRDRAKEAAAQAEIDRKHDDAKRQRREAPRAEAGGAPADGAAGREERPWRPEPRRDDRGPRRDDRGGPRREGGRDERGPRREAGGRDERPRRDAGPGERPRRDAGPDERPRADAGPDATPRAEAGPDERPRRDAGSDERPRRDAAPGERPRRDAGPGERDRGPRGEERQRRVYREGDAPRPAAAAPAAPERAELTPAAAPPAGGDGREFWEAWVDEKQKSEPVAAAAPVSMPITVVEATPAGEVISDAPLAPSTGERGERGGERRARVDEVGTVRLYLNVGKREGLSPEAVSGILRDGTPADIVAALGRVQVRDTHSYASIKEELADAAIAAFKGKKIGDRDLVVERAKR